jgi:hypothetical protein
MVSTPTGVAKARSTSGLFKLVMLSASSQPATVSDVATPMVINTARYRPDIQDLSAIVGRSGRADRR